MAKENIEVGTVFIPKSGKTEYPGRQDVILRKYRKGMFFSGVIIFDERGEKGILLGGTCGVENVRKVIKTLDPEMIIELIKNQYEPELYPKHLIDELQKLVKKDNS